MHLSLKTLTVAAATLAFALVSAPASAASVRFDVSPDDELQTFTAPATGPYNILAFGAQGGAAGSLQGGLGAQAFGTFFLEEGDTLTLLVGEMGESATLNGGGGGGSFVAGPSDEPLLVAGGGGGSLPGYAGLDGQQFHNGTGGGSTQPYGEGGGGGWLGNGTDGFTGDGGASFLNGGAGGAPSNDATGFGGFGGGGGSGIYGGGGGGGYSGGDASWPFLVSGDVVYSPAGGGGSFVADFATNAFTQTGGNLGHGSVTITAVPIPEPTAALAGIAGLGVMLLRRRS
jgi:hypothetical protein